MIDIIGTLYTPVVMAEDGETVASGGEPLEGWHVNTTPEVLAVRPDLEPFVVEPATMRRVWAGDDPENPTQTVALRFADEAEGLAALGDLAPSDGAGEA